MTKLKLVDIRKTPDARGDGTSVKGSWDVSEHDTIQVYNGTACDFSVRHAPCKLAGSSRIERGATGVYEGSSLRWSKRLEQAMALLAQQQDAIIAVMDAPPPEQTYEALHALAYYKRDIDNCIEPNKLLVLSGPANCKLPEMHDGSICYTDSAWSSMKSYFPLFCETQELSVQRLEVPLALLIGSYVPDSSPQQLLLEYPHGATVPPRLIPFITYSSPVIKPRVSSTLGISAQTNSSKEVVASVIVECEDSDTEEDAPLRHIRDTFSDDAATKGAAYFQLKELPPDSRYFAAANVAIGLVDKAMVDQRARPYVPPPPLTRVQSYAVHNNSWH